MENIIKKGSLVLIKKGTQIRTTGPKGNKEAATDYMIKVFDISRAPAVTPMTILNEDYWLEEATRHGVDIAELRELRAKNSPDYYRRMVSVGNDKITWVGAGGYWHSTDLANVEYMGEEVKA